MEFFELPRFKLSRESTVHRCTFDSLRTGATVGVYLNAAFEVTIEITFDKGPPRHKWSLDVLTKRLVGFFPLRYPIVGSTSRSRIAFEPYKIPDENSRGCFTATLLETRESLGAAAKPCTRSNGFSFKLENLDTFVNASAESLDGQRV